MIKLIATDMDGSFLRDDKSYDVARFERILKRLKNHNIKFVVASGNQYRQLTSKFPNDYKELTFIAENGSHIISKEKTIAQHFQSGEEIEALIRYIEKTFPEVAICLTGEKAGYLLETTNDSVKDFLSLHLPVMVEVKHLLPLPQDNFYKTVVVVPDGNSEPVIEAVSKELSDLSLVPVASGFGSIDLITKGMHKAWGLEQLMTMWGISAEEVMAFGDNSNDIEMLTLASESYAMANANKAVKASAKYEAKTNEEDGVLDVIEAYLDDLGY
ncbi:Cof-type HAD-IIB family hydrolase [Streptococcus thoraltensis]